MSQKIGISKTQLLSRERNRKGLCSRCAAPAAPMTLCPVCADANRQRMTRANRARGVPAWTPGGRGRPPFRNPS